MTMTLEKLTELLSSTNLVLEKSLEDSKEHFRIGSKYYVPEDTALLNSFENEKIELFNNIQLKKMKKMSSKKYSEVNTETLKISKATKVYNEKDSKNIVFSTDKLTLKSINKTKKNKVYSSNILRMTVA